MNNNSTGNLIQGASRLGIALIFGATALAAQAAPVTTQGTWWGTDGTDGTLQARDIDGNAVALNDANATFFYDTVLDITWLGDWNAGAGSSYDDGSITTDGRMTWDSAMAWAAALDVNGYTGWRLPELSGTLTRIFAYSGTDVGYNVNTANSELAHMWYVTLGNLSYYDTSGAWPQPGWGPTNTAYFMNMQLVGAVSFWSGTEYAPNLSAWRFSTNTGGQTTSNRLSQFFAVAVRSGDLLATQAVPEPGTLGLLLAALGAGAVVRRQRAH